MKLHTSIENLYNSLNKTTFKNSGDFNQKLNSWLASFPKEEREFFKNKVKGGLDRDGLIKLIDDIRSGEEKGIISIQKIKPMIYKKGDVLMHPIFGHPYILLEFREDVGWICGLITSEEKCEEILEPCLSRFFMDNFFTKTIFTTKDPIGKFMYPFENTKQVNSLLKKLKKIFC
jgi:hypothetical protein